MRSSQMSMCHVNQWCVYLLTLLALMCLSLTPAFAQQYTVADLGNFDPYSISQNGIACGQMDGKPAYVLPGGTPQIVPGLETIEGSGICFGVNHMPVGVGYVMINGEPVAWFKGPGFATAQALRVPAGTLRSYALGVNASGEIVGAAQSATQSWALRWATPTSKPKSFPFPMEAFGQLSAINSKGKAVGSQIGDGSTEIVSFTHTRGAPTVAYLTNPGIFLAISNNDWKSGFSGQVLSPNGTVRVLNAPCPDGSPSWLTEVYEINQAVSAAVSAHCDTGSYAMLWQHWVNTYVDLTAAIGNPNIVMEAATALSSVGHIGTTGWLFDGVEWVERGFLMTPVVSSVALQ